MIPESDCYNKLISQEQIKQSYQIFKRLYSNLDKKKPLNKKRQTSVTDEKILSQQPSNNLLHKVVTLDCLRTRSTNFSAQQKKTLQCVLNYFVRVHKVQYKQGLNQIAGPFILWTRVGVPLSECFAMFQKFFIKFSLNFYYDRQFTGLEMFFRMISLVLRYHCPSLSRYLAVYDIQPQIYALSWLMTLFSSKLSLQMTYLLWSYLIAQNDRYLLFFIVVGIIIRRKNQIIQTQNSSIFKIVTDMVFKSQDQLEEVLKISLILRKNTPVSLTTFFEEKQLFDRQQCYNSSSELLDHVNKLNLVVILPKQLYSSVKNHNQSQCHKPQCHICVYNRPIQLSIGKLANNRHLTKFVDISNDLKRITNEIQFVIIDLRKEKTKLNCLNQVYGVDITEPFEHIETNFLNEYLEQISSKHFTIMLTGFTFQDSSFSDREEMACAKKFIHVMNSYSFPYLGILEGGYTALSIYQQEYRIKQLEFLQQSMAYQHKNGTNQLSNRQAVCLSIDNNILLQGQHESKFSLSLMLEIFELKSSNRLKIFNGSEKISILVTQFFVIVLQDKQGLTGFLSYIQHNCSVMPYFYSHFKDVSCKLVKVVPIVNITKMKTKVYDQNVMIIKYSRQTQKKPEQRRRTIQIRIESLRLSGQSVEIGQFLVQELRQLLAVKKMASLQKGQQKNQMGKQQNIKQKKLTISMKGKQVVRELANAVTDRYKSQLAKRVYFSMGKQ